MTASGRRIAELVGEVPTVLVIGRTDRGKTTTVRALVEAWTRAGERVGWVDADVGQGAWGPPAVQTLVVCESGEEPRVEARWFVGSTSPRGHMLPTVVGVAKLAARARERGCRRVVVDTTGLVAPSEGGVALKTWKAEALAPCAVVALERDRELEPIAGPMERDPRFRVVRQRSPEGVRERSFEERAASRAARFRRHFEGAGEIRVSPDLPVYGMGRPLPGRLVGVLDREGWCLGLGVVSRVGPDGWWVRAPVPPDRVGALRWGSLRIDPATGEERT